MSWRIIKTLINKDFKLFFRNKFFGIMTIVGIVLYIFFCFVMPTTVDETIEIGLYAPQASNMSYENIEEGLIIRYVETEDELKQAIIDKELHIGISIPEDMQKSLLSGKKPQLFVYYSSDLPDEIEEIYTMLISEMINEMSGFKIDIDDVEIVLGPDMGGKQIPHRDRQGDNRRVPGLHQGPEEADLGDSHRPQIQLGRIVAGCHGWFPVGGHRLQGQSPRFRHDSRNTFCASFA